MNITEPIRDKKQLKNLMEVFKPGTKNFLLLVFALNTGLRISDIRMTKVREAKKGEWVGYEQKTGKHKKLAFNSKLTLLIRDYVETHGLSDDDYIFYSNKDKKKPITRIQAHRIVSYAGDMIGVQLSCHSLRKTYGYHAYQDGIDLSLLQFIFNHSSQRITLRYIGITQDHANEVMSNFSLGI